MDGTEELYFVAVLQDILKCDYDHAATIIAEKNFNALRVLELKKFLGHYKSQGFGKLKTSCNRAQLLIEIQEFVANPGSRKRAQVEYEAPSSILAPDPPPSLRANALTAPPVFDNTDDEEEYMYQQIYCLPPPIHPLMRRTEAEPMIRNLRQYGFNTDQIISGMEANPTCLDSETLMFAIIAMEEQRELNADIDMAIIASEQERDAIQDRKRRRVTEIESDVAERLMEIEEFQNSILLGRKKISSNNNSSCSSCNTGSSALVSLIGLLESSAFLSHFAKCNNIADDGSVCDRPLAEVSEVRKAIVSLLLAEKNALKWYKEDAYNYFLCLQQRIDETCGPLLARYVGADTDASASPMEQCQSFLLREKEHLDVVLYAMPECAGAVPLEFRRLNTNGAVCNSKDFCLDDDGLEIIK